MADNIILLGVQTVNGHFMSSNLLFKNTIFLLIYLLIRG